MSKQTINLGTPPTGVGGDTPRSAFTKTQTNFDEIYAFLGAAGSPAALPPALPIAKGGTGSTTAHGLGQATSIPISIGDLDSSTLLTGMYSVVTASGGTRGLPYGTYNLWVNRFNSSTLAGQIAINVTTGTMYVRHSQSVSFVDTSSIGVGQLWTDLTSSRSIGTTYTNTTGRPIQLAGVAGPASGSATTVIVTVGSMAVYGNYSGAAGNYLAFPMVIIPPGSTYSVAAANGTAVLVNWRELR
ncbi:hypothetical protein [Pseudomonas thivervalensis]|jgi:hypothetical protein|uniref:hypothetical protein n=1 Tax=Pseudomonas thivervalensis TaxID=86265 RepID=UPI000A8D20D7|nr:hypothetical protein [Pseudomonas thivervalensis]